MTNKSILAPLEWRYATKLYDTTKKVSKEDLETILEAGRLAPSFAGAQPWHFIVISNQDIKDQLFAHSYGNMQVKQAPYLIVLCRITDYNEEYIQDIIKNTADIRWLSTEVLQWYKDMLTLAMSFSDKITKTNVYIPLGTMIYAAAQLGVDSSPMWWFDPKAYDEVLWLEEKWLESVVLLAVGYRDESDPASKVAKVRRSMDRVVSYIE